MGKRYLRIAALLCVAGYAVSIGAAFIRFEFQAKELEQAATQEFTDLVDKANAAAALGFMDAAFKDAVKAELGRTRALGAFIISGPDGPEFAVERSAGYLDSASASPKFAARFDTAPRPMVSALRVESTRNATLSASRLRAYPEDLFVIFRDAFLMTLIPTAAALLLFMLWNVETRQARAEKRRDEPAVEEKAIDTPNFDEEIQIPEIADEIIADAEAPIEQDGDQRTSLDIETESGLEGNAPADFDAPNLPDEEPLDGQAPAETACAEAPQGLYSARSGLGWEEYLMERLSAELRRAASFEQDLVLAYFELGPEVSDAAFKEFGDALVSFYSFRDLAFERGSKGAAAVLPNMDIDHALRMADEFFSRQGLKLGLRIGLSGRAGRLVEAERLVAETTSALGKAMEEGGSPIVAFKPDLERYRSFISSSR